MTRRLGGHEAVWRGKKGVFTAYVTHDDYRLDDQ
jgi:hypothetical protein